MVSIQHENVFFEKLKTGINLFTGAGFSVLPSPDGSKLPDAASLADEIIRVFKLNISKEIGLELISLGAQHVDKIGFEKFLRHKFRVNDINPLYNVLNKVNIKSYITTNIDNLFYVITEKDSEKYVNSLFKGKAKGPGKAVDYIPLHGDITDLDSKLYFGAFELARAFAENAKLFTVLQSELMKFPTLFWGYGFHDGSVMNSIGEIMEENRSNIWIQFRGGDEKREFYEDMGFNIIVGDTEELLRKIEEELSFTAPLKTLPSPIGHIWDDYRIPTQNSLKIHIDAAQYFKEGIMGWNVIFSKYPYDSRYVLEAYNKFLKSKNLIIIGSPQSGKTTLLRQIAIALDTPCYYMNEIDVAKAEKLINALGRQDIKLLIDDCACDMNAFSLFAANPHIHLLGTADEYEYESSKHLLAGVNYDIYVIPDIERAEANMTYEHIFPAIRKDSFSYSRNEGEKYSYWEFDIDNIRDVITEEKVKLFLSSIEDQSIRGLLFLTAYLTNNKSYLSTDVLWYYLGVHDYDKIQDVIRRANEALRTISEELEPDLNDQDYYSLRSHIFGRYLLDVAQNDYKKEYANVVKRLIYEVPRGVITKYNSFRRSAYDAGFFYRLFGYGQEEIYDKIYSFDGNAYILQQKALYLSRCHRFNEAFLLIDKAAMERPGNFSIKNTKAIITFEANKYSSSVEAQTQRHNAMAILKECYHSDRRKIFHAQKFAEYALALKHDYNDASYLDTAQEWLQSIMNEGGFSKTTQSLTTQLTKELQ